MCSQQPSCHTRQLEWGNAACMAESEPSRTAFLLSQSSGRRSKASLSTTLYLTRIPPGLAAACSAER